MKIKLGIKIVWAFFFLGGGGGGGNHKTGVFLGVISMHIGTFLKVKGQNGDIFVGC